MPFCSLFYSLILSAFAIQPRLNVTEMVTLSDRITVAYVSSTEVRWSATPEGGLETIVWLSPTHHFKGETTDSIELRVEGGQLGHHSTWVEDEADLQEGARYLLFLHQTSEGHWRVLAGPQGTLELRSELNPHATPLHVVKGILGDKDAL